jgi:hypothetical protein
MNPDLLQRLLAIATRQRVGLGTLPDDARRLVLAAPAAVLAAGDAVPEREVNARLRASLEAEAAFLATDHVELRRWLADTGWWRRDGFGHAYERTPREAMPAPVAAIDAALAAALGGLPLAEAVLEARGAAARERDLRRQRWARGAAAVVANGTPPAAKGGSVTGAARLR